MIFFQMKEKVYYTQGVHVRGKKCSFSNLSEISLIIFSAIFS